MKMERKIRAEVTAKDEVRADRAIIDGFMERHGKEWRELADLAEEEGTCLRAKEKRDILDEDGSRGEKKDFDGSPS